MKKQLRFLQSGMGCTERIQATYSALSGASKKIADFVIDHPDQAVHMTVVQLAESCEVSEASVVRFCQCLQYAGFYEFKLSLAAEIVPASQMIQEDITVEDTEPTILEKVFAGEQQRSRKRFKCSTGRTLFQRSIISRFPIRWNFSPAAMPGLSPGRPFTGFADRH